MVKLPKVHHLIRYFLILGILTFVGYVKQWMPQIFVIFVGPAIYLAYGLKKVVVQYVWSIPSSPNVQFYGLLLPMTLLYYGLVGFQLKQLWNERGKIRLLSLAVFIGFIVFIHYKSASALNGYFNGNT